MDIILVNEEWIRKWLNQMLKGMGRTISDHCPIYLQNSLRDWGPKPFKFFNVWLSHPEFKGLEMEQLHPKGETKAS
ncbi:hypothetical protein ACS0TY_014523 [Phlomoides rotata]